MVPFVSIGVKAGEGEQWGLRAPQLQNLWDFSDKTLMIRATTTERAHYKIMLSA